MRQKNLTATVLYGAAAAVWLALCARDLFATGQMDGLRVLAAVVWFVAFLEQLSRFRRQ